MAVAPGGFRVPSTNLYRHPEFADDPTAFGRWAADRIEEGLVRGFLPAVLFDNGLYCRPDDRGDVVVQVAPPLICGQAEFDEMEQILRHTLTEAKKTDLTQKLI